MNKIRKVIFEDHPILGDLELDFCGRDGKAVDTVIIAGENGAGKSTVLNELYGAFTDEFTSNFSMILECGENTILREHKRYTPADSCVYVSNQNGRKRKTPKIELTSIFSGVDTNYGSKEDGSERVNDAAYLSLSTNDAGRRASTGLTREINQLITDFQRQDDIRLANAVRQNPKLTMEQIKVEQKMCRFTSAFEIIFDQLRYSRVEVLNNHEEIFFQKNKIDIPIEKLSTGEKQIVYRGCFLLKSVDALEGPIVFIDEPELGLHPDWQKKIMDFYKRLFTDSTGRQTSQIIVATHSPFIIHNENRIDDKVIVLKRDQKGDVVVEDKPEYYKCDSVEVVQDAFAINCFNNLKPTVFLEGKTDEKYFRTAQKVYEYDNLPFEFKWIGHLNSNNQEEFTGSSSLDKASCCLMNMSIKLNIKNVFLYDSDNPRKEKDQNNVCIRNLQKYKNSMDIDDGIENALVLDGFDKKQIFKQFYKKIKGGRKYVFDLQKSKFCDYICSLGEERLKMIFSNLKIEIDKIVAIYKRP